MDNTYRRMLIDAIVGNSPSYDAMSTDEISKCGSYSGGFKSEWTWHRNELAKLPNDSLELVYSRVKEWYNKDN
jgi:hypothetical protein